MTKHILVSDPDRYGESQEVALCAAHLGEALKIEGLGLGEYVIDADDDIDCEECGRGKAS